MAGKAKKKKKKTFVFTFDSLVQALGAVDHWSDMVTSKVQSSKAIVHVVPMQRFTVCMSGDGSSVMSCFCVPLCTVQRIQSSASTLPVDSEPSGRAGLLNRGISPFWRCSNSTSIVLLGDWLCLDLSPHSPENSAPLTWTALSVPHNCFVMVGRLALHFLFD